MKPWIRSADAPGYEVVTLTTVFDSFGYCRIGSEVAARKPISRISRLTTTDSTGRLMKMSVQTIAKRSELIAWRASRNRRRRIGRDRDCRARLQLELADGDDAIALLQPAEDFGTPIDPVAGAHEGANRGQAGLAVILLLFGDQEHRVAV